MSPYPYNTSVTYATSFITIAIKSVSNHHNTLMVTCVNVSSGSSASGAEEEGERREIGEGAARARGQAGEGLNQWILLRCASCCFESALVTDDVGASTVNDDDDDDDDDDDNNNNKYA